VTGCNLHRRWAGLKPPLRPDARVVGALREVTAAHARRVLLLGVTPELADIGETTVAVDMSEEMIAAAWPGDTDTRRAIRGNWLDMPLREREFSAVIGDGSLVFVPLDTYGRLLDQLRRLLLPDARLAVRVYETPEACETVVELRDQVMQGMRMGFHAFKWRLAMAIVAETGLASIPVALIHSVFELEFDDRSALAAASGWSLEEIAEIDQYAGQESVFSFPTRAELLAELSPHLTNPRFLASGSYELAERCPILVAEVRA
jgi:SAM-dependent methyltransferase